MVPDALGLQMGNTILSAYIVDNYPEYANEVITFYSVVINVSLIYNQSSSCADISVDVSFHQSMVYLLLD